MLSTGATTPSYDTFASADGPDHFEVDVRSRLIVHSRPSAASPAVAKLPRGPVVENLGRREAAGRTWCHIADGDAPGWAAGEYLVEAGGPVRAARSAPAVPAGGAADATTERVRFPRGRNGTELTDDLPPQDSRRYVLGASGGQDLHVRLAANGPGTTYMISNPDGSTLLDEVEASQEYRGKFWQSGDHVVTVRNTANGAQSCAVIFEIR